MFFLLVSTTCAQPPRHQTEFDFRVSNLLSEMTLEEKVGQLNLFDVDGRGRSQYTMASRASRNRAMVIPKAVPRVERPKRQMINGPGSR
jgi:hypothetical protein